METKYHWEQPQNEQSDIDLDVVVESSLAMAQATIQKAMRESNLRNAELADRLERPRSFVSKMLNGSHNLTVKTLARAMAVCGYELTWAYQPIQWGWGQKSCVIGRAYGDEPIKLIAISDWGNAIEVKREGDTDSVGFRKEALFQFDQSLFDQLSAAFAEKDRTALMRLWGAAKH
jgi:hypothetical protein